MKRLTYSVLISLLLAFPLLAQTDYTDTVLLLDEIERQIFETPDAETMEKAITDIDTVLASGFEELYPRARILLYLSNESLKELGRTAAGEENTYELPVYSKRHIGTGSIICSAIGLSGILGYVSLNLWADSVYFNDYANLGPDDAEKAAESLNMWKGLDNASYISLGIGVLGFSLAPLFFTFTDPQPTTINPESSILLRGVSSAQKFTALQNRKTELESEYEQAVKRKPLRRALTFGSLGMTIASGVATGICAYLSREAHLDYSAAATSSKADEYKQYANFLDILTASSAAATGIFGFGTVLIAATSPSTEEIRNEIEAIDYQLENWVRF